MSPSGNPLPSEQAIQDALKIKLKAIMPGTFFIDSTQIIQLAR